VDGKTSADATAPYPSKAEDLWRGFEIKNDISKKTHASGAWVRVVRVVRG